jgi:hypothetical protein
MVRDWILCLLIIVMVAVPVYAGESHDVNFLEARTQSVNVVEGDEIRFDLFGDTHSLIVEDVGRGDSIKFDIAPFIETGNNKIYPGFVSLDTVMKVDLDRDGTNDISLALYSIDDLGIAQVVIQDNSGDEVENEVTGEATGLIGEQKTSENKTMYYILGALVVLGIAYMVYRNTSEDSEETKEEIVEEKEVPIDDVDPLDEVEEPKETEKVEEDEKTGSKEVEEKEETNSKKKKSSDKA